MKRVLITGGAGFIGSNLAVALHKKNYEVVVLDNLSPQIHGKDIEQSELYQKAKSVAEVIIGSVTNKRQLKKAIKKVDVVVHLAAETGTGQSMYEIFRYTNVNVNGTGLLLDILANSRHQVKKVVIASSRAIYGEGRYNCPTHGNVYPLARKIEDLEKGDFEIKCPDCNVDVSLLSTNEDSKIHPTSIYGITKQTQEELVLVGCQALGVEAVALRYQNVYGPGQSLKNPYTGILSIFSTRLLNGNSINIFEDGTESRDFVYIDDVVAATVASIESESSNGHAINVGTGVSTSVVEVTEALIDCFGITVPYNVSGKFRLGDIRHNYADMTKAKELLNFEPQVDFKTGIKLFVDWVKTQEVQEDSYEKSILEMKKKGLYK